MTVSEKVALSALPREISSLIDEQDRARVPNYRRLWGMIVDGQLAEVEQTATGRYSVERSALPGIVQKLGLRMKPVAKAGGRKPQPQAAA